MAKSLVIVESPAKARTIKGFLGPGYEVMASMGHVRDLPIRTLGVDTEDAFKPTYEVIKGKGKIVKQIRASAKKCETIYLAADQDREGEAISWHVKAILLRSGAPCFRVLFNEITKSAIARAIADPHQLDMDKVDAQQARRVLDRLVGYKVSPFLWRTLKTNLSAGRVQSVALRLVWEREKEIEAFVPQEYWTIKIFLADEEGRSLEAVLALENRKKVKLTCAAEADRAYDALCGEQYIVSKVDRVAKATKQPAPFITSSLQQESSVRLGLSPERTMKIAQELYEGVNIRGEGHVGLITYMRTDSYRLASVAQKAARDFIRGQWGDRYVPSRTPVYGSRKRAQDAHEAIRPTNVHRKPADLTEQLSKQQFRLYELIWRRFLASQMEREKVEVTTILITAGRYTLRASGVMKLFDGHAVLWPAKRTEEELPLLEKGQLLTLKRLEKKQQFTKPKPRFTEASLVKELEARGIGRPSTYATILSTLKRRRYVSIESKQLKPTELGRAVCTILVERFPELFAVGFTAQLEERLDKVEVGELSWVQVVSDFYESFRAQLVAAESAQSEVRKAIQRDSGEKCPICERPLLVKFGRHGEFLACSGFPSCRHTQPLHKHREGTPPTETDARCPKCDAPMVRRAGRFGEFLACSRYPGCRTTMPLSTGIPCPNEGCTGTLVTRRSKAGKRFFGCSRYPECKFATWSEPEAVTCPACGAGAASKAKKGNKEALVCLRCGQEVAR